MNETQSQDQDESEDKLKLGVTDLFDLSDEEYDKQYTGFTIPQDEINKYQPRFITINDTSSLNLYETDIDYLRHLKIIPLYFNWRKKRSYRCSKIQCSCGVR